MRPSRPHLHCATYSTCQVCQPSAAFDEASGRAIPSFSGRGDDGSRWRYGVRPASSSQHTRRALPFDSCWRAKVGRRPSTRVSVRKHGRDSWESSSLPRCVCRVAACLSGASMGWSHCPCPRLAVPGQGLAWHAFGQRRSSSLQPASRHCWTSLLVPWKEASRSGHQCQCYI